jgi:hypothetical protein
MAAPVVCCSYNKSAHRSQALAQEQAVVKRVLTPGKKKGGKAEKLAADDDDDVADGEADADAAAGDDDMVDF